MEQRPKLKEWIYHAEWAFFMAVVIGCFLFCHAESVKVNDRLDSHAQQTTARIDDLHREFYQLLKEMRDERRSK